MRNNTASDTVLLGHGSGGSMMRELIDEIFFQAYASDELNTGDDAAVLNLSSSKLAFSTDSFVVKPLFFPGGNIGHLAVCGTVNDVATSGARPCVLSASFIIGEGFPVHQLREIATTMAQTAKEAGVRIVTGDTKVVERASCDGLFINTAGIGVFDDLNEDDGEEFGLSGMRCMPGDKVLVSGSLGDHGITVMAEREGLNFSSDLKSDAAPLNHLIAEVRAAAPHVRAFRDPTRGGIASTLNEFAEQSQVDIHLFEESIPVKPAVQGACDMLGYDVLHVANEGKMVAIVPEEEAQAALAAMRGNCYGVDAALIGEVREVGSLSKSSDELRSPKVYLHTAFGGVRIVDMLVGEQLPRIC